MNSKLGVILLILVTVGLGAAQWEGSYTMQCRNLTSEQEYTEEVKIYGPMSGTYVVECTSKDDFSSGDGIEFNGMLFNYATAIGYPVGVYSNDRDQLYGLVITEDGETITKSIRGQCPLELDPIDASLAGTYVVDGAADDASFSYSDTVILEPADDMWEVSHIVHTEGYEDQPGSVEPTGSGFQIGDMLVLCFNGDYLKVFDIEDGTLEGRWIVYYWDVENNCAVVTTGQERTEKIETQ